MFEFLRAIEIDADVARATGEARVDDHALFDDHFPGLPVLPGSWLVELGAQVSGLLCEEVHRRTFGARRFAILGMVRNAKFLGATTLPARIKLEATVLREEIRSFVVLATAHQDDETRMRAELVLTMHEPTSEWGRAIEARDERFSHLLKRGVL